MFLAGWSDKDHNSLMYEPPGMFINPDKEGEWSNYPYNKEQRKVWKVDQRFHKIRDKVIAHLTRTDRSILEEIELIKTKKSTLPKYCREWLLNS